MAISVVSIALLILAGAVVVAFDLGRESARSLASLEVKHANLVEDFEKIGTLLALSEAKFEALKKEIDTIHTNHSSMNSRQNARPTDSEKVLMTSLNALRSGLQIGVSSEKYNELVREARASVSGLLSNEQASDFSRAVDSYLENHARITSVWNQILISDGGAYISENSQPDLHAWLRELLDSKALSSEDGSGLRDGGSAIHVYSRKIGELWSVSERNWPAIERIWSELKK